MGKEIKGNTNPTPEWEDAEALQRDRKEDCQEKYAYWLSNIEGIGNKTIRTLLKYAQTPQGIYGLPEEVLKPLLKPAQLKSFLSSRHNWDLGREYDKLIASQICIALPGTLSYPKRLASIPDRPEILYVKGKCPSGTKPSVAIVGARLCSPYGRQEAVHFASVLAAAGVQIVSGMARGIDGLAQEAALRSGGESFAVLGSGVDVCYPEENRRLYEALLQKGGILSEYPPGTRPRAALFPPRNRIISGLADCLLVVEAREKSGTFITVDMALEQGREVFVLPGRTTDSLSAGCNRLIRQGARMALSPEEMLEELWAMPEREKGEPQNFAQGCCNRGVRSGLKRRTAGKTHSDAEGCPVGKTHSGAEGCPVGKTHSGAEGRPSGKMQSGAQASVEEQHTCLPRRRIGACRSDEKGAGPAEETLLDILFSYPSGLSRLKEELEKEGIRLSVPELTQLLTQLCMEGRIVQENGHFFVRHTENIRTEEN